MRFRKIRKGTALLMSMIVLATLAAWAVAIYSVSGTNLQLAQNQQKANAARACAESGLEVVRYWLSHVLMPSATPPAHYAGTITTHLRDDFQANTISNIAIGDNGFIPTVILDSTSGRSFSGQLSIDPNTPTILRVYVTGSVGQFTCTIGISYDIEPYEFPIFDFGLATRGALRFPNNPSMQGANSNWEADIYIESLNNLIALAAAGNVNFDGDISIGNPGANVDFQADVLIAGEQGQPAIDNHVTIGTDPVEFPVPDTDRFLQYATGDLIDSATDTSGHMRLTNVVIEAGTNPTFAGNVIIEGVMFVEQPNIITFERNVQLNGTIVGDGDVNNPGTNSMSFLGNFATGPYPNGAEFDAIRSEIGSSIVAPGFAASFAGNFAALDGVAAVSGADFSGNVSAIVKGSIINYADTPMTIRGNAAMTFDRSANIKIPAGFDLYRVLNYDAGSYSEVPI
jgi:hypothetical protein